MGRCVGWATAVVGTSEGSLVGLGVGGELGADVGERTGVPVGEALGTPVTEKEGTLCLRVVCLLSQYFDPATLLYELR